MLGERIPGSSFLIHTSPPLKSMLFPNRHRERFNSGSTTLEPDDRSQSLYTRIR